MSYVVHVLQQRDYSGEGLLDERSERALRGPFEHGAERHHGGLAVAGDVGADRVADEGHEVVEHRVAHGLANEQQALVRAVLRVQLSLIFKT